MRALTNRVMADSARKRMFAHLATRPDHASFSDMDRDWNSTRRDLQATLAYYESTAMRAPQVTTHDEAAHLIALSQSEWIRNATEEHEISIECMVIALSRWT